jgi:hypothetical protein
MSWYETAKNSILQTKIDNPNVSREKLKEIFSKNYPFGERNRHPYKAWLKAMNDEFGSNARIKQAKKIGQHDMFA